MAERPTVSQHVSIPEDTVNPPDGATEPDGVEDGASLDPTRTGSDPAQVASVGSSPDDEVESTEQAGAGDAAVEAEPDPVAAAQAEATRLRDQLLRTAADFDNYRKRSRRDVDDAERRGREELLRELLPVFDNLERAVAHAETAPDVNSLADGIAMVRRQFLDTLGKVGIERIEALGKPFDPAVHEAIQQVETDDFEPGTVANEFQAGYRMGERLLRPAMVVVAKRPPSGD